MKLFLSPWIKVFVGMATLVVLVFLSDTPAVMYLREGTLTFERSLSNSWIGAFLFPRAGRELPPGSYDGSGIKALMFELEATKKENELLRDALDFSRSSGPSAGGLKAASVFSYSNELGKETLLIDVGTDKGIGKGALALESGVFLLDLVPIDMPVRKGDFVGFSPKRGAPSSRTIFFLGEVVGESKTESTVFKAVRTVSPVLPAALTTIFILP